MIQIHHLNCVLIESPFGKAIGHCLLLEENKKLLLIDTGIGLLETRAPEKKLGKELIEIVGFKFQEEITAIKQIEHLGCPATQVEHIICSHLDPDHIGGIADFPQAKVHVSTEEYNSFQSGNPRYLSQQLSHAPEIELYEVNDSEWLGLPARKVNVPFDTDIYLIPLFGHTLGHCGIAIRTGDSWIFYVGDAYYLRAELTDRNHPVDELASLRADNNEQRLVSLDIVRKVIQDHSHTIDYFGYHDPIEMK